MSFSSALCGYTEARNKPRKVGDLLQDDLFQIESEKICTYKKKSEDFNKALKDRAASLSTEGNANSDFDDLTLFHAYKKMRGDYSITDVLPRGAALDVSLRVDMSKCDTWKQPVLDEVYKYEKMDLIPVKTDTTSFEDFENSVTAFNRRVQVNRNLYLNTPALAFSVENLKIPKCEFQNMIAARNCGKTDFGFSIKTSEVNLMEVPAIFTVSDGFNLRIEFKFPWTCKPLNSDQDPGYEVSYNLCDIQSYMIDFWKSLPILFSIDAKDQVNCLIRFLQDLYDIDLNLVVFDLKALAVTAGLRMDEMDILTLSMVCCGRVFPNNLGNFDQGWADDTTEQPRLMLEFLYIKLYYLSHMYRVLMGLILRGCFPDPDICLHGTEMTQASFIAYFCHFVGDALSTADVSVDRLMGYTRQEMISEMNPGSMNLLYLSELIIEVPVPQCGGARFLHPVRKSFLNQYYVLKKIKLPQFKEERPNQNKDLDAEETSVMYDREISLTDPRNGDPVTSFGLQPSPQFEDSVLAIDVLNGDVLDFVPPRDRRIVPAMEEWGRLNPKLIPKVFQQLRSVESNDLRKFWVPRIRVYDKFRLIILRVLGIKDSVEILEDITQMRRFHVQDHYKKVEEKRTKDYQNRDHSRGVTARILVNQKQRVDLLNHEVNYAGTADRVGIDRNVHDVIPGDYAHRNLKWKQRREKRKARKLSGRTDVIPQRQFNEEKRLRAISNHGIDIDAPLHRPTSETKTQMPKPVSETRTVRFVEDHSEQPGTSRQIKVGEFSRPNHSSGESSRPRFSSEESSKSRHSSGESSRSRHSSEESSRSRHSSGYSSGVESRFSGDYDYSRPSGGSKGWNPGDYQYRSDFVNYKRPRSEDDLRNTLERNSDLRDTVERRMVYSKRPRDDHHFRKY